MKEDDISEKFAILTDHENRILQLEKKLGFSKRTGRITEFNACVALGIENSRKPFPKDKFLEAVSYCQHIDENDTHARKKYLERLKKHLEWNPGSVEILDKIKRVNASLNED